MMTTAGWSDQQASEVTVIVFSQLYTGADGGLPASRCLACSTESSAVAVEMSQLSGKTPDYAAVQQQAPCSTTLTLG